MSLTMNIFKLGRDEMLVSTRSHFLRLKLRVVMESKHSAVISTDWVIVLTSSACCHATIQPLVFM